VILWKRAFIPAKRGKKKETWRRRSSKFVHGDFLAGNPLQQFTDMVKNRDVLTGVDFMAPVYNFIYAWTMVVLVLPLIMVNHVYRKLKSGKNLYFFVIYAFVNSSCNVENNSRIYS
jgi:uncharacterized membrane protein